MATRTVTIMTDDISGKDITEEGRTVRFALDGQAYEIDLSTDHAAGLREALAPYIAAARRTLAPVTRGRAAATAAPKSSYGYTPGEVRAWARKHDLPHNPQGRLSNALVEAWRANDPSKAPGYQPAAELLSEVLGDDGRDAGEVLMIALNRAADQADATEGETKTTEQLAADLGLEGEELSSPVPAPRKAGPVISKVEVKEWFRNSLPAMLREPAKGEASGDETEARRAVIEGIDDQDDNESEPDWKQWAPNEEDDRKATNAKVRAWLKAQGRTTTGIPRTSDAMEWRQWYELNPTK